MDKDAEIQRSVINEFKREPILNMAEIGVSVRNGIVALSGYVNAYSKKLTAQRVVWRVKEVRAVTLDIKIILPSENTLTDTIIAENVLQKLWCHNPASTGRIRVKVECGQVYLEGEIDSIKEKEAVINAVWYLNCVKDVIDEIIIKAAPVVFTDVDEFGVKKRKIIRGEWFVVYEDEMEDRFVA